jgi:predicted O-methyltransferase YrrM
MAGTMGSPRSMGAVQGVRRFLERLSTDQRLSATAIQTVGTKGYDGIALAVMTKAP